MPATVPNSSGYPVRRRRATVRRIDAEAIVYDPASHEALFLNETALLLWDHADGRHRTGDLLEHISRQADDNFAKAMQRAAGALQAMVQHGWLELRTRPEPAPRAEACECHDVAPGEGATAASDAPEHRRSASHRLTVGSEGAALAPDASNGADGGVAVGVQGEPLPYGRGSAGGGAPRGLKPAARSDVTRLDSAHFRIGVVHVAVTTDVRQVASDFVRLYGRYRVGEPMPDSIDVRIRRTWGRPLWRRGYRIEVDGRERFTVSSPDAVLPHLEWAINGGVIETLPRYFQIHAGVVARDGVGVILPAQPQSGKSTLVTCLLSRGWRYLSDEFALIDPDSLRLAAYPKAVCIKQGSFPILRRLGLSDVLDRTYSKASKGRVAFVDPHRFGTDVVAEDVPVRLIVFPKYVERSEPIVAPVSRARAAFEMMSYAFSLTRFRVYGVDVLANVVAGARCYRLETGDPMLACERIEALAADDSGRRSNRVGGFASVRSDGDAADRVGEVVSGRVESVTRNDDRSCALQAAGRLP